MVAALAFAAASIVDLDAAARAAGNRRAQAVALARVLLRTTWPAQVLRIRVDGAGTHTVAGLVLSGVKFHRALDPPSFEAEVVALVRSAFASSGVEEVDVWATVPLPYVKQEPVNGEYLKPTTRTVFAATVMRSEAAGLAARLARGDGAFWDPSWKRTLGPAQGDGAAQGSHAAQGQS